MDLSVVIPLLNEADSLPELCNWIVRVADENNISYEILLIDDGSTDDSWNVISELSTNNANIKGIKFRRNYGKSAALNTGFQAAKGEVVITMDADLQDNPDEIPGLMQMINEEGYHLVSGWKKERFDPASKTIPTKLFNAATRAVTGIKLNDFNCGLKAYKNDIVKAIEVYGEMHRYIPALAKWNGFPKIGEKVVKHQARKYGTTKFGGWNRFINGFLDLLSVTFTAKFGKKPMHFFGSLGTLVFIAGGLMTLFVLIRKLYSIYIDNPLERITQDPLFYFALVTLVIGVQLFLAGFLGELISRNGIGRNKYNISETKGFEKDLILPLNSENAFANSSVKL